MGGKLLALASIIVLIASLYNVKDNDLLVSQLYYLLMAVNVVYILPAYFKITKWQINKRDLQLLCFIDFVMILTTAVILLVVKMENPVGWNCIAVLMKFVFLFFINFTTFESLKNSQDK